MNLNSFQIDPGRVFTVGAEYVMLSGFRLTVRRIWDDGKGDVSIAYEVSRGFDSVKKGGDATPNSLFWLIAWDAPSDLHSSNAERGLYVIKCGTGFSCLGFDVAERWRVGVLEWMGRPYPNAGRYELGTPEHYRAYCAAMDEGRAHASRTGTKCPVQLTPALIGFEGKRVEVTLPDGTRNRFRVGKSGGWMPIHLEISGGDPSGGPATYVPEGATVRALS